MKNPLNRRFLRELRTEAGKYLAIFILLVLSISFVSGFLVADGSMIRAYEDSFEVYNIEDGHILPSETLSKVQKARAEELGITLTPLFYAERKLTNGSTLRIFGPRSEVDRVCLMSGRFPEEKGEILLDHMYASNNGISVGDTVSSARASWTVTGLGAFSDYSALFENNADSMFDSIRFGVGMVSAADFASFDENSLVPCYAWKYRTAPENESEEKELSDELMKKLADLLPLEDYVPRYQNQAIRFTGEDMGSDKAMMEVLLYMIIAILAFVFAVTASNTIEKEAAVIGTLRATGWTRMELIHHYMVMPLLVTLAAAAAGNILGYTALKHVVVYMYYNSYSLPTYVTVWSPEALWKTTLIPIAMMLVITFTVLSRRLLLPPLKFLRRDLRRRRQKRALPLSPRLPFFSRFRLRVLLQNLPNYLVLLVGILFANMLLIFGLGLPEILENYENSIGDQMFCNYQYMLKMPVSLAGDDFRMEKALSSFFFPFDIMTSNPDAEKFSAYELKTVESKEAKQEEILAYGIQRGSRYIPLSLSPEDVYISSSYAEKYDLTAGSAIRLREPYEDTAYDFTVTGIFPYEGSLSVYMDINALNRTFDLGEDTFVGYFSDTPVTDIDRRYIGSVIDLEALTRISRQLDVSMGSMMGLVDGFAVVIFIVLIYILSKMILDKNAQSISMAKILGYTDREISRLYITPTTIFFFAALAGTLPAETEFLKWIFKMMLKLEMTGWIPFHLGRDVYIKAFLLGVLSYAAVAFLEYRKIRQIPMDEALKNVE